MKGKIFHNFKITIKKHEDQLFGIQLFMQGINTLYGYNKSIMEINIRSFESIMKRGNTAILQAKELLEKVKSGKAQPHELELFQFPPIHGPGLDEMTQRATLLVKTYEKLFPNRPRNIPLTEEEHAHLMQEVINNF